MKNNKIAILGLSIVLVVVLVIGLVTNVNRHKNSSYDNDNAAMLGSTTKSVSSICSLTDHKKTCVDSLNSLANNQTATPKDFLQKSIQIASQEVGLVLERSGSTVGGKANDSFNKMAYDDCKDLLNSAIDELQASFSSVGDTQLHTINDRKDELNNWLSAVVSYQQTCMDGFTQPDVKESMSTELLNATQLTDNALAILSAMSQILSQFNISIPNAAAAAAAAADAPPPAAQPNDGGGSKATSRRLLNREDDDHYNKWGFVPSRRMMNQEDDDYYNGKGFVQTRQLSDENEKPNEDEYYNGKGFVPTRRLQNVDDDDYYNHHGFVATRGLQNVDDDDYYNHQGFVPTRRLQKNIDDDDYYNHQGFVPTRRLQNMDDDDYYNHHGFVPTRRLQNIDDDDYYNHQGFVPTRQLQNVDDDDFYNGHGFVPTRRLQNENNDDHNNDKTKRSTNDDDGNYPKWLKGKDRHLLAAAKAHAPMPTPNAVVAQDGSGQYKTITQALAAYPKKPLNGSSRYVIYVKAGVYQEYVMITKAQTNVLIYGDGPRKTRVTGNKCFTRGVPTYQTATFTAIGNGFMAMAMGMANTAGPEGHQAVALRVQSDMSVIYNCRIDGNQDTLYAQTHRQFYRNCVISGTIDFIFGDSSVIIQNSLIVVRKPMDNQQNTVTAQGRTNIHETTGIVIQNCRIVPDLSLQPLRFKLPTYLGRPWKQFSRAVIMESTLADFIHPDGWMPWLGTFALDTLYFAEYANRGPGANTAKRIKWKGFHVLTNSRDALQFTVAPFIQGDRWLKPTGVPYSLGLI